MYAFKPSPVTLWIESNIAASVWSSHFSTAPLASATEMGFIKGTSSSSSEIMAVMRKSSPSNLSFATPSKHFFRCGCTRVGSFVSDKISSISSLDRKKKRGKNKRFFSRYAESPFWIASNRMLHSSRRSSRSLSLPIAMTSGASLVAFMMSRHSLSTWRNFSPSSGICFTMSSDEKMGSRYSHVC